MKLVFRTAALAAFTAGLLAGATSAHAARAYIGSADYQAAAKLREGAGTVTMRLLVDPA